MDELNKLILDTDYTNLQTGFLKARSQQHNDASFLDWLYDVLPVHLTMQYAPSVSELHLADALI